MIRFLKGDCRDVLKSLPDASVQCCVTSPPYFGLRSYLPDDHRDKALEMGGERSVDEFVAALVEVFREVSRVLRDDGCLFVNIGDSYARNPGKGQHKPGHSGKQDYIITRGGEKASGGFVSDALRDKQLLMVPARLALALQADGWILRSQMPWVKRGCMPESVSDRPGSAVEYVYLLTKQERYFWDADAVKQVGTIKAGTRAAKGGNVRSRVKEVNGRPPEYWDYTGERNFRNGDLFFESISAPHGAVTDENGDILALDVNTKPFAEAHFAVFPTKLITPLIHAATSERGACAACGAPLVRTLGPRKVTGGRGAGNGFARPGRVSIGGEGNETPWVPTARVTTGWLPSCQCPQANPVPCVVLDPFSGAGTTAVVADRLGRDAIGIDLSDAYAGMARDRLIKDAGLFANVEYQP